MDHYTRIVMDMSGEILEESTEEVLTTIPEPVTKIIKVSKVASMDFSTLMVGPNYSITLDGVRINDTGYMIGCHSVIKDENVLLCSVMILTGTEIEAERKCLHMLYKWLKMELANKCENSELIELDYSLLSRKERPLLCIVPTSMCPPFPVNRHDDILALLTSSILMLSK